MKLLCTISAFEDTATKFFEHFIFIAEALNEHNLWNEEDKFFYDVLNVAGADPMPLRIRSIVGLTPLFAVSNIYAWELNKLNDFKKRITWFENYRKKNNKFWPNEERSGDAEILLSLVRKERLINLLNYLLDENEFLSPGGIRAFQNTILNILILQRLMALLIPFNTIRATALPICLAATATGAARCGCRSIFSSFNLFANMANFMAIVCWLNALLAQAIR